MAVGSDFGQNGIGRSSAVTIVVSVSMFVDLAVQLCITMGRENKFTCEVSLVINNQLARKYNLSSVQSRRCRHERESGGQCKANARQGAEFCFFHDPALDSERMAARKAGGIERSRKFVLPANVPVKPLRTVSDVIELLSDTINHVRRGEMDLRASNSIGYLSGILLSAIEKGAFEERLAALEAAVSNPHDPNDLPFEEHTAFEFMPGQANSSND